MQESAIENGTADIAGDWNEFNRRVVGRSYLYKHKIRRFLRDYWSYAHLMRAFDLKSAYNLFFTRTSIPTGEGSQRWFYHLGLQKFLTKYPDLVPVPTFFEMETTTVCNKKCFICEHTHWPKGAQEIRHTTLEEFKHVAEQFPTVRWVNLTGEGSSFLNKDFIPMIRYLRERFKTSVWLVDHLSDITQEQIEELQGLVHGIYVSMDGATAKTYQMVKEGCDFNKAVGNLRHIVNLKRQRKSPFPHLHFRYVLINDNLSEVPMFLDLLNSMAMPWEWGGASGVEFTGLLYFPEIERHYVRQIPPYLADEVAKRKDGIYFRFEHAVEDMNPPIDCCLAWMEPYLMLPGYILPCCAVLMSNNRPHLRKYSFGNVYRKNFVDIWKGDYYTKFRKMVVDPEAPVPRICAGCRAYQTKHRIKKYGIWDEAPDNS